MAHIFVFPGQGSQSVGMGKELAEAFPAAAAVFEEVDDALGEKLSDTIWNGPDDVLTLTANAQPALMAMSMAVVRVLEYKGFALKDHVSHVAGHSLGEYSALCAAGLFSVADTAKLLRIRGEAMQAAVPAGKGAMAAIIGLEHSVVEGICGNAVGACQIANDNGGGQLVISGEKDAVEMAMAAASEAGAKRAIPLAVSAPFHSSLMAPAAEAMAEALANAETGAMLMPVLSNVTVTPTTDGEEIKKRLVDQVTGTVRWRESIEWFAANGLTSHREIGAGKVLSGLARRIDRSVTCTSVGTVEGIEALLAE